MEEKMTNIYFLVCPVINQVRFIGQSVDPKKALQRHLWSNNPENLEITTWMKLLRHKGLRPILKVVDTVPKKEVNNILREMIKSGLDAGWPLLNKHLSPNYLHDDRSEMRLKIRDELGCGNR